MIYACLHLETCGDAQLFNIADSDVLCKYGECRLRLVAWFCRRGTDLAAAEVSNRPE